MKTTALLAAILSFACAEQIVFNAEESLLNNAQSPPFYPTPLGGRIVEAKWDSAYERAREFVADLSILEKVNLTTGVGFGLGRCLGNTGDIPRLDFLGLCLQDGPIGVRKSEFVTSTTTELAAGASFNKALNYDRASAIALEFRGKGVDIALGPCVGPLGAKAQGGRNWEAFGADPYLQGQMAALAVRGLQDNGIMANGKHFVAYEQEFFRQYDEFHNMYGYSDMNEVISSNVDERALREIYAYPFGDMVHAGVGSIMCSYNKINNSEGCSNSYLLNGVLKEELGFPGFVMSDWFAQHPSGVLSAVNGLDLSMPGNAFGNEKGWSFWGGNLTAMVYNGTLPQWRLDDMATRIMAAYFYVGIDKYREEFHPDGPNFHSFSDLEYDFTYPGADGDGPYSKVNDFVDVRSAFSEKIARQSAVEAVTLLKNDGILPLKPATSSKPLRVTVIGKAAVPDPAGPNCEDDLACSNGAMGSGWGSGAVNYPFLITPLEAFNARAQASGHLSVNYHSDPYNDLDRLDTMASLADVNFIFGLTNSGEAFLQVDGNLGDRKNVSLWHNADEIILRTLEHNSNNVIVVSTVGPVDLERWIEHPNVTAVLLTTPSGQFFGDAIADVVFGDANPSGRLPFTIAKSSDHYVPLVDTLPANGAPQDNFDESIYVDYRYFDEYKIEPRFEFGFGLSYSNFTIKGAEIKEIHKPGQFLPKPPAFEPVQLAPKEEPVAQSALFPESLYRIRNYIYPYVDSEAQLKPGKPFVFPEGYSEEHPAEPSINGGGIGGNPELWKTAYSVSTTVTNNGPYDGAYVVQLYLGMPQGDEELKTPPRQLRGFEKVSLAVGETTDVQLDLLVRDLAVYDVREAAWVVQRGEYTVYIGSSSREFSEVATFIL